jgi:hypothetical protein
MHASFVRWCRGRSDCCRPERFRRLSASRYVWRCLEALSLGLSLVSGPLFELASRGRARLPYRRAEDLFKAAAGGATLHQLWHSALTSTAQGASLRELMERMGHSSARAALIYLHATRERDEAIARGMGQLLTDARKTSKRPE